MGRMDKEKGGFTLYMPKIAPNSYVPGQRSTMAGMWYCKGALLERTFEKDEESGEWGFKLTRDPFSQWLMKEIVAAKTEMARIQDIYVELGKDSNLHNANYEFQFGYVIKKDRVAYTATLWGYRPCAVQFVGQSFEEVCKKYRKALEAYLLLFHSGFFAPELKAVKPENKHWMIAFDPNKNRKVARAYNYAIEGIAEKYKYKVFHQVGSDNPNYRQAWEFWHPSDKNVLKGLIPEIHARAMEIFKEL